MDDATLRAGLRRITSHAPIPDVAVQQVHEAAAALQIRRAELSAQLAAGERVDAEVVAVGISDINLWLYDLLEDARELVSAKPVGRAAGLRSSLPVNRAFLAQGGTMASLFDYLGTDDEARILLANEPPGTYVLGVAPVQMKIYDRRLLVVQGPPVDGQISLMRVWAPACVEAAWRYWHTAMQHTIPLGSARPRPDRLTSRQRQVMALLAADLSDEAVAETLGVSVRTVRSDVAAVLQALGVKSRFAAGVRLAMRDGQPDDPQALGSPE